MLTQENNNKKEIWNLESGICTHQADQQTLFIRNISPKTTSFIQSLHIPLSLSQSLYHSTYTQVQHPIKRFIQTQQQVLETLPDAHFLFFFCFFAGIIFLGLVYQ